MQRPAADLADLVRGGEIGAVELAEASLRAIEALDPRVNAFTHVDAEGALAAAARIAPGDPRPFAGVPIAVKDNRPVAGLPLRNGARLMGDHVPAYDANLVRRLRRAGFVIVGKTSLPELGVLNVTEPARFGPTGNPWDLARTAGGSSGGSAAAVAAGMVPIAHGNDGGGSIRIPAACCGLVGLKGARGRVSAGPDSGDSFLGVDGVLTRTVRDTALALDVLAGYEPGDSTWAPPPAEPFALTAAREPAPARIAVTVEGGLPDAPVEPCAARAVRDAAGALAGLGHAVDGFDPPWRRGDLMAVFLGLWAPAVASGVAYAASVAGRPPAREDVEPLTWMLWERAARLTATQHVLALNRAQGIARGMVAALVAFDAVLLPTLAWRPPPHGSIDPCAPDPEATLERSARFTPHTAIANLMGLPAISLPLFHGEDGLPVAVQLIGRPAGEGALLALAAQLEGALPWAGRLAPPPAGP